MSTAPEIAMLDVWKDKSPTLINEIVTTWEDAKVLPSGVDAQARAQEVVMIVRNSKGIIGITTAKKMHYEPLRNEVYFMRGFIVPSFRIPGLFVKMISSTLERLEQDFREHQSEQKPIGVIAEVENPRLKQANVTRLVSGMTLLGFTKKHNPIYVHYFKGSRY